MNLYIKIDENNNPKDHPIIEDNFKQAFPEIDLENLPVQFAKFIQVPKPNLGPYDKDILSHYEWAGAEVTEIWTIIPMTVEERLQKIEYFVAAPHHASWIFNEELCEWVAPISKPEDGKQYTWDESMQNWVGMLES
jgi:hypothetical protein